MSEKKSLVSIIIPLYNAEKYIAESIESVLYQTYTNIEILLINDGSTDNSLQVAKQYERENLKIFSQENKGASAARNYGLREAKGEYIQFLDADDLLSTNKIEEQVNLIKGDSTKISVCPIIHFFDGENLDEKAIDTEWYHGVFDNPVNFLFELYGGGSREGGMIQPNSWLVSKSIIEKAGYWNENLTLDDDGEYFCRVIMASSGIKCANTAINYYRKFRGKKSLSALSDSIAIKSAYLSLNLKAQHLSEYYAQNKYKKAFSRAYKRFGVQTYPEFRDISSACIKKVELLGGTDHDVVLGGKRIEILKKIFGWKVARLLQYFLYRIIN